MILRINIPTVDNVCYVTNGHIPDASDLLYLALTDFCMNKSGPDLHLWPDWK